MTKPLAPRAPAIAGATAGIVGVLMLIESFGINQGPPLGATTDQLIAFAETHFRAVMWGAWLQAVGPWLIVSFALTLVKLSGAMESLAGWLTLLGASILMMVSLAEVVFYISALDPVPALMGEISNAIGHAIQHLYFFIAAPALFLPLGAVLWSSSVLPRIFSVLALLIGAAFFVLGISSLYERILSTAVTSFAPLQALWWLAAAIVVLWRSRRMAEEARS